MTQISGRFQDDNFELEPIKLSTKYGQNMINHNLIINYGDSLITRSPNDDDNMILQKQKTVFQSLDVRKQTLA